MNIANSTNHQLRRGRMRYTRRPSDNAKWFVSHTHKNRQQRRHVVLESGKRVFIPAAIWRGQARNVPYVKP